MTMYYIKARYNYSVTKRVHIDLYYIDENKAHDAFEWLKKYNPKSNNSEIDIYNIDLKLDDGENTTELNKIYELYMPDSELISSEEYIYCSAKALKKILGECNYEYMADNESVEFEVTCLSICNLSYISHRYAYLSKLYNDSKVEQ